MTESKSGDALGALRELQASEGRYRQLIRHVPIPILTVDAREAGRVFGGLKAEGVSDLPAYLREHPGVIDYANAQVVITSANEEALSLFDCDADALLGPVGYVFEATPDAAARVMTARFEGQRNHNEQMKIRTKTGEIRDVLLMVIYPAASEPLDATLLMMIDITERLQTEERVRQLEADFTQASRAALLGELITSIAHEIKQPLSAIMINGQTSLRWLSQSEPNIAKVEQLTDRIVESARQANTILQRIQDMAVPRGRRWDRLDLNEVVREALGFVRHELDREDIELDLCCEAGPLWAEGDRIQLQQVIVTLLVNSSQVMRDTRRPDQKITLNTARCPEGGVAILLKDNGPGIPEEAAETVFEGLFSTESGGLVIGLAMCHSIIRAHGGTIQSRNLKEGGAEFIVALPGADDIQP
jgi:two-component system, LuxR family, sensor kinase FixL